MNPDLNTDEELDTTEEYMSDDAAELLTGIMEVLHEEIELTAYDDWSRRTLNEEDEYDETWLHDKARLIWPDYHVPKRIEYKTALMRTISASFLSELTFDFNRLACLDKEDLRTINAPTGGEWYEAYRNKLTTMLEHTIRYVHCKVPEWIATLIELLECARNSISDNFNAWKCGLQEEIEKFDTDGTKKPLPGYLLHLINMCGPYGVFRLESLVLDTGDKFQPQVFDGTILDRDLTLTSKKFQHLAYWKDLNTVMFTPYSVITGDVYLTGFDRYTQKLADDVIREHRAEQLNPGVDNPALIDARKNIKLVRDGWTYQYSVIKALHDLYFPRVTNNSAHSSNDLISLSPYGRRFVNNVSIATSTNLFVYPKLLTSDNLLKEEWTSNGLLWYFCSTFPEKVLEDRILPDLRDMRRCAAMWQSVIAGGNFLFEPNDWHFDLILPGDIFRLLFSLDRCDMNSNFAPCKEVAEGSDNWYYSIADSFDGIREVQCDQCHCIEHATNTRIMCQVTAIEGGQLCDYIDAFVGSICNKDLEYSYYCDCDTNWMECDHFRCNANDFKIARLQLFPLERVCADCLQSNWVYCSDIFLTVDPSKGFGFWHKASREQVKSAKF